MADIITDSIEISSGVISSGLSIGMGGEASVLGGTVTDAAAFDGGYFWVEQGGYVSNVSLRDYGEVFVDGGRADNITLETGGQVDVYDGVMHTGTVLSGGVGIVYEAGSGLNIAVSDGGRFLVYGGYVADTVITSGGSFVIQTSGGLAADTVVSSGGHARVVSGAQASRTTLTDGGRLDMLLGYMYDTVIQSGGRMEIMSGQAYNTDIQSGGSLAVSAAGEAHSAVVKGGLLNVLSGTLYDADVQAGSAILTDAASFRLKLNGGYVQALSGTYLTEGALNSGVLDLKSGAVLVGAELNGASLEAEAGAVVSRGILNVGMSVSSGVIFSRTQVNAGTLTVQVGAIVDGTTVSSGGVLSVLTGASVSSTTVNTGGRFELAGTADGVRLNGTSSYANGEYILGADGGLLHVSSGALATDVVVSCGTVNVDGGLVSGLTMDKGEIVIGAGGVVRGAVLKGFFGGYSFDTYSDSGNDGISLGGYSGVPFLTGDGMTYLNVDGTGAAAGAVTVGDVIPIINFPDIILYPTTPIYIVGSTPSMGYLTVSSGGLLEDAEASAMQIAVSGGGVIRNLSATSNTWVTVSSGGTLTGRMSFVNGTTVTAMSGGIVDFDLSAQAPGNQVLLTGLSSVVGAPLYTITVSAGQAAGSYVLADGATGFTGTLTVRNTDWATLGTLTVGTLTEIGGLYYLAKAKKDVLSLTIWTEMPTILPDPETVYLNTAWSDLEDGASVTISGVGTATIGYDAFAEMDAANDAVADQGTIVITGCEAAIPGTIDRNVIVAAGASVTGGSVGANGILTLKSGSSARDVAVLSGGTFTVEAGATLTVTQPSSFNSSGTLTVDGVFNFDISGSTGNTSSLLGSVANVKGAPTFTLTVGDNQAAGAYKLVGTPDGYNAFVLTVVDRFGTELGTVGISYTQQEDGGYLESRTDAVIDGKRYSIQKETASSHIIFYSDINIIYGNGGYRLVISPETEKPYYVYVSSTWNGKTVGETISVLNPDTQLTDSATFGVDAFATLDEAVAAGDETGVITISGGTFAGTGAIAQRNVVLSSGSLENMAVMQTLTVSYGTVQNLTVADGGVVRVSGGTVRNLTVTAGGAFTASGGILSGGTFAAGSTVAFTSSSGWLCFDISETTPDGAAAYDGLTYVTGAANGRILLKDGQAKGVYVLGTNAAGFSPEFIIGVKNSRSTEWWTDAPITVGGSYRQYGTSYSIAETDGVLTLTIASYEMADTVYVNTAWKGLEFGETVTLRNGSTATFGVDAFATYYTACAATGDATVYLDGGTFTFSELNISRTRKTVALDGSVISGGTLVFTSSYNINLTLENGATADSISFDKGVLTVKGGARFLGESALGSQVTVEMFDGVQLDGSLTVTGKLFLRDVSELDGTLVVTGTLSGTAAFSEQMDVTVTGTLDFDISGMTAGGPALFRGLSFVKGAPSSYSITVSSSQQEGVYMLADGLSGFEGAVTLRTSDGSTLTNLMVGNGVLINGLYYTLRGLPSDGKYSLSLVIDRNVPSPLDYVYVNSSWSNMQFGDVIHVSSGTAVYGYDAFSNLPDALATLSGGKKGTVNISGGSFSLPDREYSCNIAVNGSTLSLRGNAAGFTGLITVAQLGVVEISGIAASAATLTVDGTGTLKVSSEDGYSVSVGTLTVDGWVEFNLTGATAGAPALFQDLSGILGTPHYAIRQEGKLDPGTYLVATGATGLDVVDLRLKDRTYTLSIGGGSIVSSGARYKAVLTDDGSLALEVEGSNAVYYNYDWNGYSTGWNVTTIDGSRVTIGFDAFGQYSQAQAAVNSGGELIIEKGTAADITFRSDIDFSILKNGRLQADNCSCTLGSGRNLYVAGVFIANDLTVSSGASLLAESGSEIEVRGRAVFEENTSITVNGTFKFTLAGKNAGEAAIISGLSRIQGAPSYVLWMDKGQSRGTYVLGTEAGSFDGVITVTERDGSVIGTVSAGETLRIGKRTFTLAVDASDNLNFTISALPDASVVYVDSAWNGLAEGAAVTTPDYTPAVYQYDAFSSLDGAFGEVASGGTVVAWGGTLSRSNGMGKADVLSVRGGEVVLNGFTLDSGKMLTVSSGGAVSGTITVAFGATLTVEAGGMLTAGQITIESGASVMLDGILNFRLTGINPEDGALFRGFSYVQGSPALSLTVDGREQGGTFTLISDYGQFDGVLSVRNADGTVIGTLSVDETLVVGSTKYTLTNDETGDLRITVVKPERINVNSDWAGLAVGTTVVLKTGHTAVIGYDAFADPAEAFGRISRTGTVVIEKADIDTIGEDPGCAGIIILGDVSVRLFTVGSGVTVTVGSGGRLFTSVKGKNGDYLESGALTVSAGGAVTVEAGGVLSVGGFDFQQGASIMVNGTLDLSFVRGYVTIRKGFALIRGDTTYTMTTNGARQGFGSYFISYDEEALFRTYTVLDENGEVLGPLSVSETVEFKDRTFKLYSFYNMGGELNVVFQSIKKTLPDVSAYVNPDWEGLEDGTAVLIEDGTNSITAVIGKDAFTTYEAAAEIVSGDKGRLYIVGNVVLTAPVSRGATILSGATLSCSGLVMDSVGFTVRAGGTLEDVVIVGGVTDGMAKRMVTQGGTLRNFTIDANGDGSGMTVTISGSGRFTGYMTFKGTISGYPPIIDFDLSLAVESRALAENLYYPLHSYFFTGPTAAIPPTFRIVLEDVPAGGTCTYKLATGASDFGSTTITVVNNAGASVGTISVGGSLRVGDVVYSLYLSDDLLWLKSVGPKTDFTAPTVTVSADTETPTNLDVTITAVFADDVKLSAGYYRFGEDGEWTLCDGTVTVSENMVVYFKAVDAAGNESEIVGCTVGNIDKVAPDAPANLRAEVADHTVTLSWDAATDDFSGVAGYEVKYWTGDREFTVNTTETSLVLEDVDVAEWNWSVQTLDAAGNASGVSDGEAFAVADPEPEPCRLFFTGDFDGDGKAAFAMVDGGAVTVFGPDGSALGVLPLDDGWTVAGAGDFDGDGKSDLLRVNADGLVIGDFSNGDGTFAPQVLNLKGNGWNILGVGDFDGDGADDVLVANPTGASDTVGLIGYWKGGTEWTLLNGYSPSWEMVSAGDFDGDGKCDMLWRNSFSDANGRVYNAYCTWITDPAAGDTDWRMVSVAAPDEWNFLCSGDFDGNGSADIAMINQEGVVGIWGVKDGWLDSWSILSAVDANAWTLAGVGDFNGDGTDDIAWRSNETGLAGCWQIENKELASWQTLASLA